MRTRDAKAIRRGIMLARTGNTNAALQLPDSRRGRLAWQAFFKEAQKIRGAHHVA